MWRITVLCRVPPFDSYLLPLCLFRSLIITHSFTITSLNIFLAPSSLHTFGVPVQSCIPYPIFPRRSPSLRVRKSYIVQEGTAKAKKESRNTNLWERLPLIRHSSSSTLPLLSSFFPSPHSFLRRYQHRAHLHRHRRVTDDLLRLQGSVSRLDFPSPTADRNSASRDGGVASPTNAAEHFETKHTFSALSVSLLCSSSLFLLLSLTVTPSAPSPFSPRSLPQDAVEVQIARSGS